MCVCVWIGGEHCSTLEHHVVHVNTTQMKISALSFRPLSVPPGGVILYAGSSGSASPSPGSPSSGYQTQSPSSHSQPSSPEGVSFHEIGPVRHRRGRTPSPKLVFQFPEVNNAPVAQITTVSSATYSHPTVAKRPCGFTGTFTSKYTLHFPPSCSPLCFPCFSL